MAISRRSKSNGRADNRLYLFAVSQTGSIWHNFASAGEPFQSQWFEVPGGGISITAPSAVGFREYLYLFVVGGDHRVYMNVAAAGSAFTFWSEVPSEGMTSTPLLVIS
jgi:hypothetical protein